MRLLALDNASQTACIALLEDLLEMARDGKVVGLACAWNGPEGTVGSCYDGQSVVGLIGAVEIMKAELLQAYLEQE